MSDSNNKDPIEDLFQKKSEDYNISYREEDWNALEKRLDAVDAQITARRRRWLAAAVVLIVFSMLSYFIFQNYQEINSLNERLSQQEEVTAPPPEPMDESPGTNEADQQALDAEDSDLAESRPEDSSDESGESSAKSEDDLMNARASDTESSLASAGNSAEGVEVSSTPCPTCDNTAFHRGSMIPHSTLEGVETTGNGKQIAAAMLEKGSNLPASSTIDRQPGVSKISVGFIMGPDLSTAGSLSDFHKPGSKIGINLDYSFNRNFGISIGAIRSNVNYKAGSGEYRPPQGYWYNGIEASQTTAQCILIDIPVNLTYRFMHFDNSRVYAAVGFSSYIMLNEDYRFSYNTNQQGLPRRWNEDTGTTHLLSNASFSLGYEFDVTRNISFRAEPFLKVPVKEIGWGNVNLYSMGTLFSFNYKLQRSK